MRQLLGIALLSLCSCAGTSLNLQNSAQYQQEIHPLVAQATAVRAHIQADLTAGKTKEQIALDLGFAVFQETLAFLSVPPR